MFVKVLIFFFLNLGAIAFDYKINRNLKKSFISLSLFLYILILAYIGFFILKVYIPLKFIHFVFLIFSYMAYIYYLIKNKLYYPIFIFPIITIIIYFILAFSLGSKFEE